MPQLATINLPNHGRAEILPEIPLAVYRSRLKKTLVRMQEMGLNTLAVYGDREHCANLVFLSGFDPRFDKALLLLAAECTPGACRPSERTLRRPISPPTCCPKVDRVRASVFWRRKQHHQAIVWIP